MTRVAAFHSEHGSIKMLQIKYTSELQWHQHENCCLHWFDYTQFLCVRSNCGYLNM